MQRNTCTFGTDSSLNGKICTQQNSLIVQMEEYHAKGKHLIGNNIFMISLSFVKTCLNISSNEFKS